MFKVYAGKDEVRYNTFTFPGGEESVKIDEATKRSNVNDTFTIRINIEGNIESSKQLIELLLLTDALRRFYFIYFENIVVHLKVPYFPYARQDRVMVDRESFSLDIITNIINAQHYRSVTICDPHSEVVVSLLNDCKVINQSTFVYKLVDDYPELFENCILVAPDAGAIKKTQASSQMLSIPMIHAEKKRDVNTGQITGTKIHTDGIVTAKSLLIVDDICDGGRTFIELAKALKQEVGTDKKIYLYVTHGIFSKGLDVFDGLIDMVFCPNVFSSVEDHPKLRRI